MEDHRKIHAPEFQRGMPRPPSRPSCHTTEWPVSARAPRFWDMGRACGNSLTPALWEIALHHTPLCKGCTRGLRGLLLYRGPEWWPRSACYRAGFSYPPDFDISDLTHERTQHEDAAAERPAV